MGLFHKSKSKFKLNKKELTNSFDVVDKYYPAMHSSLIIYTGQKIHNKYYDMPGVVRDELVGLGLVSFSYIESIFNITFESSGRHDMINKFNKLWDKLKDMSKAINSELMDKYLELIEYDSNNTYPADFSALDRGNLIFNATYQVKDWVMKSFCGMFVEGAIQRTVDNQEIPDEQYKSSTTDVLTGANRLFDQAMDILKSRKNPDKHFTWESFLTSKDSEDYKSWENLLFQWGPTIKGFNKNLLDDKNTFAKWLKKIKPDDFLSMLGDKVNQDFKWGILEAWAILVIKAKGWF